MQFTTARGSVWGHEWRSSPFFIVSAMAMALFTDVFLYTFVVPILPYILERRLGLPVSLTQRLSFALLAESAIVSLICSPFIGHYADQMSSKKILLLASLAAALFSTILLAMATSMFTLFFGRLIQAIASSFIWTVGYATIADNVNQEHLGKTYGMISLVVSAGTSGGPMAAGILFEIGGYWLAWSSAFVILVVDIVLRALMIERPKTQPGTPRTEGQDPENDPLLPSSDIIVEEKKGWHFYAYMFQHRQFVCGAMSYFVFAILISSFDTTIPLHVRDVFGWGSMMSGMLFVGLQGPGIIMSPLCGWLKDRYGTRYPIAAGFAILTPIMWVLGMPGDDRFPWVNRDNNGQIIYVACVIAVGTFSCLLNGAGTIEATVTVDEIEARHPGIFGPNGGYSRALSVSSMSWTSGAFIGPILSGYLTERVGYYEMNCVIAVLCALSSVNAFWNLKSKARATGDQSAK
ncbi:major facilitator superfamily domain-containing protein [Aspergillus coremiiformis]|uniref:Major facilitator superfamily domain-containing protein n=1 Tax=Aspergillus coremiiformis TaxID=138285 RepID=A0A5N6ZEM3_9EURO|nr:major facilitator superfamily domain-containing protein [Aspergillus coremiiformis]